MATNKTGDAAEKAAAVEVTEEKKNEIVVGSKEWFNERVSVTLFKDGDKYKDDLVVGVNGDMIKIPRGVPTMVKRKHALLIEQSLIQDTSASDLIKKFVDEAKKAEKA